MIGILSNLQDKRAIGKIEKMYDWKLYQIAMKQYVENILDLIKR